MASIAQRVSTDRCAKCHKKFKQGDRVSIAHIIIGTGNINSGKPFDNGSTLSGDFELYHVRCEDTGLDAAILRG